MDYSKSKFDSPLAERLYGYSLESGQEAESGSVETCCWAGLFTSELAILIVDSQGFVEAILCNNDAELQAEWQAILVDHGEAYE